MLALLDINLGDFVAASGTLDELAQLVTSSTQFTFSDRWPETLAISENQALFSLLGTTYGGDGRTTFNLPDLRGKSLEGIGQAPGQDAVQLGREHEGQKVGLSDDARAAGETQGTVGINYCICLQGLYPSRN